FSYGRGLAFPRPAPLLPEACEGVKRRAVLGGDEKLLAAARSGDQVSFERLIEPHIAVGYRLAAAMLSDAGHAEDAVQDATLRAWRSIGQLRSSTHVRGWFLAIVANRSR